MLPALFAKYKIMMYGGQGAFMGSPECCFTNFTVQPLNDNEMLFIINLECFLEIHATLTTA